MAGVCAIVFVRGKVPPADTVSLAKEKEIPLLATRLTLYEAFGRLYQAGLPSCGVFDLGSDSWRAAFDRGPLK
jgi:hypothetical protein